MNAHGERVFVTMQIGRSHIGPEKRARAKCCCSCWHFWSDNWHQVWVHVTFKNRTCENYMSWEFTFIACMAAQQSPYAAAAACIFSYYYYTIFDGKRPKLNCQVWTALDTPGSFWEKMRIFGSCQKCSIGGRDEKICSCQIRFLSNGRTAQQHEHKY